jgi:hypothetical protein
VTIQGTAAGVRRGHPLMLAVLVAAIVIAYATVGLDSFVPPVARCSMPGCKEGREWIAASLTLAVFLGGLFQYSRAQVWKERSFLRLR